jgi:hypothetical protein
VSVAVLAAVLAGGVAALAVGGGRMPSALTRPAPSVTAVASPVAGPATTPSADPASKPTSVPADLPAASTAGSRGRPVPVLADGAYDGYIRKVDARRATIVVDLIQVLSGEAAVRAAVEDGRPKAEAEYAQLWIRNRNPRLRTLLVASDVRMQAPGTCEGDRALVGRNAVLARVARDPHHGNPNWYFAMRVRHGSVSSIDPRLAAPAC